MSYWHQVPDDADSNTAFVLVLIIIELGFILTMMAGGC